jgi:hypothetical protein
MHDELVLEEELNDFKGISSFEGSETFNERDRDEFMILHAHLYSCEDSEVLLCQIVDEIWV